MKKIISEKEILSMKNEIDNSLEFVESFNKYNCVTPKTKLIIVGTLTPPKGAGYFYTAPRNRIYGYMDEYFGTQENGLRKLKRQLRDKNITDEERMKIVNRIKDFLTEHDVAFLDVIKYAIRKKGSHLDSDIKYYCLETAYFDENPKAKIICNSKLAKDCFLKISDKQFLSNNMEYLSQMWGKKDEWLKAFKSAGI